jgi:hypothetical protein
MRRISSKATYFNKRIFPLIWFGVLFVFVGVSVFGARHQNTNSFMPFLIMLVIMIILGFVIMKKLVFDLVDEVWDDGNALVVKNRGQEQRIALNDVKNVSYSPFMNPPRVTLSLRRTTVFGDQITFGAPLRFVPFSTSPLIDDLINRIDAAREQRAQKQRQI